MTTTVVQARGRCLCCNATIVMIYGTWKTQHVTKDYDWRCTGRAGYKGHVTA